jgi:hypothetical protein
MSSRFSNRVFFHREEVDAMPDDETVLPGDSQPESHDESRSEPQPNPEADAQSDAQRQRELPLPSGASSDPPAPDPSSPRKPPRRSDSAPPSIRRPHQSQHTPKDAKGRFLRKDGSFTPASARPRQKRKRQPTRVKHFRVDLLLTDPAERAEYDRLLADPNQTTVMLTEWLHAHGHSVCHTAVCRHRRHAQADLWQLRECSRMASMFCTLSRQHGAGAIAEANQSKFEMDLMQDLFKMHEDKKDRKSPQWWNQMSKTLAGMVATRRSVEEMRADFEAKAKAAVEAVKKLDSRDRGREIAERVKAILGA